MSFFVNSKHNGQKEGSGYLQEMNAINYRECAIHGAAQNFNLQELSLSMFNLSWGNLFLEYTTRVGK